MIITPGCLQNNEKVGHKCICKSDGPRACIQTLLKKMLKYTYLTYMIMYLWDKDHSLMEITTSVE